MCQYLHPDLDVTNLIFHVMNDYTTFMKDNPSEWVEGHVFGCISVHHCASINSKVIYIIPLHVWNLPCRIPFSWYTKLSSLLLHQRMP